MHLPGEKTQLRDVDTASIGVDGAAHDGSAGKHSLFVVNSSVVDFSDCGKRGKWLKFEAYKISIASP